MKTLPILSSCALLVAATACASGGLSHRVDEASMAGLSPEQQAEFAQHQQSLEGAQASKEKAQKDLALATYELDKARSNRDLVSNRIDHMEGLKDAAENLGDETRVQDADGVLSGLKALLEAHDEEIDWLEAEVDYYEVGIELADAKIAMADAALEESRATAVHEAELPSREQVKLEDFTKASY